VTQQGTVKLSQETWELVEPPLYLTVGRIVGAFGLRGEVKVEVHTDLPERFRAQQRVFMGSADQPRSVVILAARPHQAHVLLLLDGCADRTDAEALVGQWLYIPSAEAAPLGDDEFYEHELLDATVEADDGAVLGQVKEVLFTGANQVLVVQGPSGEVLVPMLRDVVLQVDRTAGRIWVSLPPGLIDV
jgi:16S rRNA processing protein RimM